MRNLISVALGNEVFLYNPENQSINKIGSAPDFIDVCHTSFSKDGRSLSCGYTNGLVKVWDVETQKVKRSFEERQGRSCTASWSSTLLSTGSVDGSIRHADLRVHNATIAITQSHTSEICGLKWSPDET